MTNSKIQPISQKPFQEAPELLSSQKAPSALLVIPAESWKRLPSNDISVADFFSVDLPFITKDPLGSKSATSLYSKHQPITDVRVIRAVPPKHTIQALENQLGSMWLNGAQSLNLDGKKYPFWILNYWKEIHRLIEAKTMWRDCERWLSGLQRKKHALNTSFMTAVDEVKELLSVLAWNGDVKTANGPTKTIEFTRLLADNWLNDVVIDTIISHLEMRLVGTPSNTCRPILRTSGFTSVLVNTEHQVNYNHTVLAGVVNLVQERKKTDLYFIANVNANHWVAFHVDFVSRTIRYGDSLLGAPPSQVLDALDRWIDHSFHDRFAHLGNQLPIGMQQDSVSCGFCATNALAHALFQDELWTHREWAVHQVVWFKTIVKNLRLQSEEVKEDAFNTTLEISSPAHIEEQHVSLVAGIGDIPMPNILPIAKLSQSSPITNANGANTEPTLAESAMEVERPGLGIDTECVTESDSVHCSGSSYDDESSNGSESDVDIPPIAQPSTFRHAFTPIPKKHNLSPSTSPERKRPKRKVTYSATNTLDSSEEDSVSPRLSRQALPKKLGPSATRARTLNASVKDKTFVIDATRQEHWKKLILHEDPRAMFKNDDVKNVRHFGCGKWVVVDEPYNVTKFRKHLARCKGRGKTGNSNPIYTFFKCTGEEDNQRRPPTPPTRFCPGITPGYEQAVETYLTRTGASGGGGVSITALANQFYGKKYKMLSHHEKRFIKEARMHTYTWNNEHIRGCVRAVACTRKESLPMNRVICSECDKVSRSKAFKKVLAKKMPPPEHFKYLNREYNNEQLGMIYMKTKGVAELLNSKSQKGTVLGNFVKGALKDEFDSKHVFLGLIEAMTLRAAKKRRGVGLQNMKYPPAFDDFCHLAYLISPQVYHILRVHLGGRAPRSFQRRQAGQPSFLITWGPNIFTRATDYVNGVHYEGPLALAVDDTKLLASLRVYYDNKERMWFLVGGIGDPIPVANEQELREIIDQGKVEKATKLRLWALHIPLPKVPPLVLAAKTLGNSNDAEALYQMTRQLLDGLAQANLHVVSISSDGTEVERSYQRLLVERAHSHVKYTIPHPLGMPGLQSLNIVIPILNGYHFMVIQDSNHCRKTGRNNLFSGARMLVLGNYPASYGLMRQMADEPGSPLFSTDVNKGDKQDDAAAIRLMNADTLEHLVRNHPDAIGHIIFLFIWGELVDAIQSRHLEHSARIAMALRAYYFFDLWAAFLKKAVYPQHRYFISREAHDIIQMVVVGLIGLVVIYRDYTAHHEGPSPFIPWLHSTEVCEHLFGELRKQITDFTFLNAIYCIPKLSAIMRGILLSTDVDGKARASGYLHTWFDTRGIDLVALSTYPNDTEILDISKQAFREADALFSQLDIPSITFLTPAATDELPGIQHLFHAAEQGFRGGANSVNEKHRFETMCMQLGLILFDGDNNNDNDDSVDTVSLEEDEYTLEDIIKEAEDMPLSCRALDSQKERLAIAAVASLADETAQIRQLPEDTEDDVYQDLKNIRATKETCMLPRNGLRPRFDLTASLEANGYMALVEIRRNNQTIQAATGSKRFYAPKPTEQMSARVNLMRGLAQVIKEQEERGISTGLQRKARWMEDKDAGTSKTGNAANAEQAVKRTATEKTNTRMQTFSKHNLPLLLCLNNGEVDNLCKLRPGDYGIACVGHRILAVKVIQIFSKGGGKNGAHGWIPDCDMIGKVSYLSVQLFEFWFANRFRIVPERNMALNAKSFCHLPGQYWLCRLPGKVQIEKLGPTEILAVGHEAAARFSTLTDCLPAILAAYKSLNSRGNQAATEKEK